MWNRANKWGPFSMRDESLPKHKTTSKMLCDTWLTWSDCSKQRQKESRKKSKKLNRMEISKHLKRKMIKLLMETILKWLITNMTLKKPFLKMRKKIVMKLFHKVVLKEEKLGAPNNLVNPNILRTTTPRKKIRMQKMLPRCPTRSKPGEVWQSWVCSIVRNAVKVCTKVGNFLKFWTKIEIQTPWKSFKSAT